MSTPGERPWPSVPWWRRYGPVLVIVAALIGAGVAATVHERGSTLSAPAPSSQAGGAVARAAVPVTYAEAARQHRLGDYDWGPGCDPRTGRVRLPTVYAPPCVPVFHGDNGGATWAGVTGRTVTVAYYQAPPGDLVSAIQGAAGTPAANLATAEAYVAMLNHVLETYGRTVRLVLYDATGDSTDAVAARTDALNVAEQLHAFASINGPAQTDVYATTLASLHVLCLDCGLGYTQAQYEAVAPYVWGDLPTVDSILTVAFTYVTRDLVGRDAVWAGNPAFRHQRRTFDVVHYDQNPPIYAGLTDELDRRFARSGLHLRLQETYLLDLTTLPDQAATIAEHLKRSGATTVIFAGDPIMPIYLTKACAAIGYYPEWVITGTVFTDSSTLGRYYDQAEWAHAFGVSSLAVPTPLANGDAYRLYRWWYGAGTTPPAPGTASVVLPSLELLFFGIDLAGPHLTPATFAAGVFHYPPSGGGPTTPLDAYGYRGAAPLPSYATPADYTFIWYDATARGTDEEGVEGAGLMRYVAGGARYRDGTAPPGPVPMFTVAGSVTSYPVLPPADRPPVYPPWPGSPASRR